MIRELRDGDVEAYVELRCEAGLLLLNQVDAGHLFGRSAQRFGCAPIYYLAATRFAPAITTRGLSAQSELYFHYFSSIQFA
jgi:hypothetical protein